MAGIVVDHKETGVRYAVSESNFNPQVHERVRDLRPGETVLGYRPRRKGALGTPAEGVTPQEAAGDAAETAASAAPTQAEGSAPAGTKGK